MTSAITSGSGGSVAIAGDRAAKMSALSKQEGKLRQEIAQATNGDAHSSGEPKTAEIAVELVNVQAQIERLMLENQLSKLTAQARKDDAHSNAVDPTRSESSRQKVGAAHRSKLPVPYDAAAGVGRVVNAVA